MKIAVASNNGERVGQHFGRARLMVVLTVEDGEITDRDLRERRNPHHGPDREARSHGDCFDVADTISDCQALIVGGMGMGAFTKFQSAGIEAVLTDARSVDEAATRYERGDLPHLPDRLHGGGGNDHKD